MDIAIDIIMENAGWTQESTYLSSLITNLLRVRIILAVAYCKNAKTLNQIMLRHMLCSTVYMIVTT